MSIIGNPIMAGVGASVPAASIFVTGLSETDIVTATKGSKTLAGKWVTKTKTVNEPLIPAMTSNTTPSGVASASRMDSRYSAHYAFDGNDSTHAYGGSGGAYPWTIQYEFSQQVTINAFSYIVSTPTRDDGGYTANHEVQISLNGSDWETIWSGQTSRGGNNPEHGMITLEEEKAIKYVRWATTNMSSSARGATEDLYELQVYGDVEVQVSGFEISPIRDFGTWTVTATDGEHTKTQDVLVDVITEYEIKMAYEPNYLMLYDFGDECEDVTGGWTTDGYSPGIGSLTAAVKNTDNIFTAGITSGSDIHSMLGTDLSVNTSGYNAIFAFAKNISTDNSSYWPWLRVNAESKGDIWSRTSSDNPALHAQANSSGTVWLYSNTLADGGKWTTAKTWSDNPDFGNRNIYVIVASTWITTRKANWYAIFMTKADNWSKLCEIAGITTTETLPKFVVNADAITTILNSEEATRYMVKECTGDFMAFAIQSSVFISSYNASPYKAIIDANPHWSKFLAMVQ